MEEDELAEVRRAINAIRFEEWRKRFRWKWRQRFGDGDSRSGFRPPARYSSSTKQDTVRRFPETTVAAGRPQSVAGESAVTAGRSEVDQELDRRPRG
jgi:hypothetical protein